MVCNKPQCRMVVKRYGKSDGDGYKICQRCKQIVYCSKVCQVQDWNSRHKYQCEALAGVDTIPVTLRNEMIDQTLTNDELKILCKLSKIIFKADDIIEKRLEIITCAEKFRVERPTVSAAMYFWIGGSYMHMQKHKNDSVSHPETIRMLTYALSFYKAIVHNPTVYSLLCRDIALEYEKQGRFIMAHKYVDMVYNVESSEINKYIGIENCHGRLKISLSDSNSAIVSFNKALRSANKIGNAADQGDCHVSIGDYYKYMGVFMKSIVHYTEAIEKFESMEDAYSGHWLAITGLVETLCLDRQYSVAIEIQSHIPTISRILGGGYNARGALCSGIIYFIIFRQTKDLSMLNESYKWLRTAWTDLLPDDEFGSLHDQVTRQDILLYLSYVAFFLFEHTCENDCLMYLRLYLDQCIESSKCGCVTCGRSHDEIQKKCICAGCRVSRFCNVEHQMAASRKNSNIYKVRHRKICKLLSVWRCYHAGDLIGPHGNPILDDCETEMLRFLNRTLGSR
jgi:tetratricopeptide (TPR) repeat protein